MFLRTFTSKFVLQAACMAVLALSAYAGCFPSYSDDTYKRVYRSNKMYLQRMEDVTGDGKPDAYGFELQADYTYQNLVILPNNGSGGFGDPIVIPGTFPINTFNGRSQERLYSGVTIGDLNGDGKKDFVVRAATSPVSFFTFVNNGNGGYTQSLPTVVGPNEFVVYAGDINGDGRGDLVTNVVESFNDIFLSTNSLSYRLGNVDGTFGGATLLETNALISPLVADYNGDGKPDIAYTYYGNPNGYHLKVLINIGGGLFTVLPTVMNVDMHPVGARDMNGDGKVDIWGYGILFNNGSGVFTKQSLPTVPSIGLPSSYIYPFGYSILMDYDGNGTGDVVRLGDTSDTPSGYRLKYQEVFSNSGSGSFSKSNRLRPFIGTPADVDGDGKDDEVIFVNSTNGTPRASGSNETAIIVRENTCTPPATHGQNKLIDFGGDGISDLAVWKPTTGQWRFVSNLTSNSFNWGGSSFGDTAIPADYDGDGKTDAAVFRNPTGDWHIQRSSDGSYLGVHWGATGDVPVPGDFNGDGRADIAVFRPSNGDWYIYYTGTSDYLFTHFGATGDIPAAADFDGDGKHDIAVFRPSDGGWYGLKSSTGDFFAAAWGTNGDVPIPGDYDMDGKADIAVFRPGNHYWYIMRSFDGGADFVQYGLSTDRPMLVDSNGDGVMEITTFRPNSNGVGTWFASSQPLFTWAYFGAQNETALRYLLPN